MNKKILASISIVAALAVGVLIGIFVKPASEENINIEAKVMERSGSSGFLMAVVDDQMVMNEAKVYVSLKKDYETRIAKLQEEADKEREKLKKENDRIAAKRATASQEEFNREVEQFAKKQKEASEKINTKLKALEAAYVDAINKVKATGIDKILAEIAAEQKLSFITSKVVALYYEDALDVTETVISRLNKRISKTTLDVK